MKLRNSNRNPNEGVNYGPAKKIIPKIQWYALSLMLLLPVLYMIGKLVFESFYPNADGIVVLEEFSINAPVDGYVESINYLQGEDVKLNSTLIKIKSPILENQIAELKNQLESLNQEKNNYQNHEISELEILQKQTLDQMAISKDYYNSLVNYRKSGIVTIMQVNEARQQYLSYEQQYKMILAKITQSKTNFETTKNQSFDTSINKINIDLIEKTEQLNMLNITAPINGAIKHISVHVGEYVTKDKNVMILSSHDQFRVLAYVDAKFLKKVHGNAKVKMILPDNTVCGGTIENTPSFTGKIYTGLDLVKLENEQKPVIVIKPDADFPVEYRVNGIEAKVLL